MITIVQFLIACVAALVEKVFFMDLRCDVQPQPKPLLQAERSGGVAHPITCPGIRLKD